LVLLLLIAPWGLPVYSKTQQFFGSGGASCIFLYALSLYANNNNLVVKGGVFTIKKGCFYGRQHKNNFGNLNKKNWPVGFLSDWFLPVEF